MTSHRKENSQSQSYWFYTPIVVVLILGYVGGGGLAFGVQFLNWLPAISNPEARLVLSLLGMGMLGATLYATRWWAVDMDEAVNKTQFLPHFFDAFGYASTIVGGGITGIVFVPVQGAAAVATSTATSSPVRPAIAFILAFCGGLFQFKVENMLEKVVKKFGKNIEP